MKAGWAGRRLSRIGLAAAAVLVLFVGAAATDPETAGAAAHEVPGLFAFGSSVSLLGLSGYMLILSAAVMGGAILRVRTTARRPIANRARRVAEGAAFFFAAIAASGLACQGIKHLVGRARPRLLDTLGAYHIAGPTLRAGFESFPSDHSTTAFAAALALSRLRPALAVILYPAAATICVSRVLAQAHYPSDTIAGAVLGTLVTFWVARVFAARDVALRPFQSPPHVGDAVDQERDARAL